MQETFSTRRRGKTTSKSLTATSRCPLQSSKFKRSNSLTFKPRPLSISLSLYLSLSLSLSLLLSLPPHILILLSHFCLLMCVVLADRGHNLPMTTLKTRCPCKRASDQSNATLYTLKLTLLPAKLASRRCLQDTHYWPQGLYLDNSKWGC